jgi:MOSC domain-containing protein YiiM
MATIAESPLPAPRIVAQRPTRSDSTAGTVESLNVGAPRPVQVNGHSVLTAIWKHPVEGRVALHGVNLRGDDQADRTVHGGPDKTVYAYAVEDTEWWDAARTRSHRRARLDAGTRRRDS